MNKMYNNTDTNNEKEVRYRFLFGKLFEVEGIGKDKKYNRSKKKAYENAYEEAKTKIQQYNNGGNNLNFSLILSKYIPMLKEIPQNRNEEKNFELIENKSFFELFLKDIGRNKSIPERSTILEGYRTILINKFTTSSRLICGLGSSSVLETSITLHHIWGVPYIPGSSFKGVCREVVFWKLAENKNIDSEDKLENLQNKFYGDLVIDDEEILKYQLLFGARDFKGLLLFLDAYPDIKNENPFELDIMNPHYSQYYNDKEGNVVPGDWENPVPVFFLVVKKGVSFKFTVLFDEWRWQRIKQEGMVLKRDNKKYIIYFDRNESKMQNESQQIKLINLKSDEIEKLINETNFLNDIIQSALEQYGIGAKRSLGYGSFELQNKAK